LGFWQNKVSIENQLVICKSNHLGDHIKVKRKYLGLYQKDVAEIIGVSEDSITYWENKRSKPQKRYYSKIIQFLGYSPFDDSMLGGETKK